MVRWTQEKITLAQDLRSRGLTLSEVHMRLVDTFGKTSRSRTWQYVQNTPIQPEYQARWKERAGSALFRSKQEEDRALKRAQQLIRETPLSQREHLLMAAMLYWGEGTKRELCVINTDAYLLRIFIDALVNTLHIPRTRFTFALRLYEDLEPDAATVYWCGMLGLLPKQLTTVSILSGKKKGKLKYGMCRVRLLRGAPQLKLLKAIVQVVCETLRPYSSIDRTAAS